MHGLWPYLVLWLPLKYSSLLDRQKTTISKLQQDMCELEEKLHHRIVTHVHQQSASVLEARLQVWKVFRIISSACMWAKVMVFVLCVFVSVCQLLQYSHTTGCDAAYERYQQL